MKTAECCDEWITVRGIKVHCLCWRPDAPAASIVMLHGLESHAAWFGRLAEQLFARGLAVVAVDRPGSGASEGPRGDLACAGFLSDCLKAVTDRMTNGRPRFCLGFSWGARWALTGAFAQPELFDGLILMSAGLRLLVGYRFPMLCKLGLAAAFAPDETQPTPISSERLFINRDPYLTYIREDPRRVKRVSSRLLWLSFVMDRRIGRARDRLGIPVLCLTAGKDLICNNEANQVIMKKITVPEKLREICYPEAEHALVFESDRYPIAEDIAEWIRSRTSPGLELSSPA
jgi:acylglycerol lipase